MGEKPCFTLFNCSPSLVSSNHQFNVLLSCSGSYCWKWRVAGLSVFATCSLHQPSLHLHVGKGKITTPLSGLLGSFSCRDAQGASSSSSHRAELRRGAFSCLGVHSPFSEDCWPVIMFFLRPVQSMEFLLYYQTVYHPVHDHES